MTRSITRQQINSDNPRYSLVVETYQIRKSYETTTRALVNNSLKEPLIRKQTDTIVLAIEAHKHQFEIARTLIK